MDKAQTPEEQAAAQKTAPTFTEAQLAWLKDQPEPGAETPPKAEDHLADDAELKGKLDAKTQERINGRIGKEVAKTKAALEKAESLEAQLAEAATQLAQRTNASPNGKTPLDDVNDSAGLRKVVDNATAAKEQAEDLLTQLEDDPAAVERVLRESQFILKGDDGAEDFSPAKMRKFLNGVKANATRTVEREVPKRVEFLKQVDASAADAMAIYPELKDPKSEKRKAFDQMLAANPIIKSSPFWPKVTALLILGLEAEAKLKASATAPAKRSKKPLPFVMPAPRGTPPPAPATKPKGSNSDVLTDALNGDKKARLKHLQSLVS